MPINSQFPFAPFGSVLQPQNGVQASNHWATSPKPLTDDGYPDDWFVPMEDGYPDDWIPAVQTLAADGYPNDWFVPMEDGYPDDRIPASQTRAPDGYPNDWIVPASAAARPMEPDGYPNDWITPAGTAPQSSGLPRAGYPVVNALNSGSAWPARQNDYWQSVQPSSQPPSLPPYWVPASGTAETRPWWIPAAPASGWEPWADQFIRGMQGLLNAFRSRQGFGDPNAPGCKEEWDDARRQCAEWLAQQNPPRVSQVDTEMSKTALEAWSAKDAAGIPSAGNRNVENCKK